MKLPSKLELHHLLPNQREASLMGDNTIGSPTMDDPVDRKSPHTVEQCTVLSEWLRTTLANEWTITLVKVLSRSTNLPNVLSAVTLHQALL
ncbi:hypothetical protein GDO78_016666 [Eleutherodactylus coqui]|uniref:Uncharacterized protein n=1 Tax=Eleutherodactylus coqui TaxID=57060 RepID=A0A8J6EKQ8_ELECQ|nr:hypothetical protein GDO78_016666 [Eleutherodactylus coqui]